MSADGSSEPAGPRPRGAVVGRAEPGRRTPADPPEADPPPRAGIAGAGVHPSADGVAASTPAAGHNLVASTGPGSPTLPTLGTPPAEPSPDLVRSVLAQAKAAARAGAGGTSSPGRRARQPGPGAAGRTGPGPDGRDPMLVGTAIRRLVADRGWEGTTAAALVLANWDRLVGRDVAQHCQPVSLTGGTLVLVAQSSAWATQLRLLSRTLQARLATQVGEGVVTSLVIRGPAQPDWRRGPRRVRGPGPRDTYG